MDASLQTLLALIQENSALTKADQEAMIRAVKDAGKALTIAEFKLNRTAKEKRTVSILLEETIDELQRKSLVLAQANTSLTQALSKIKATQAQLVQKEKLASLGELMAGIAHEIQNPLNFVNNFSEVNSELVDELREELASGNLGEARLIIDDLAGNLNKITHHGGRASSIVRGMLEHSRTETGDKRPTPLNILTQEYLQIAYQGFRAKDKAAAPNRFNCEVVTDFDPEFGQVEVVPHEIGRVLLNLYNNAFYAVQLRHRLEESGYQPTVQVRTKRLDDQVEIRVSDNGPGIPAAIQHKIFQPFFTTKPTGEGTGLGLSLSYDIITKGHGGSLTVSSQEGRGSEFIMHLPA